VELTDKVQISAGGENSANLISTAIWSYYKMVLQPIQERSNW
jgi:hypothetical protein